jgi:hypothetical protein
VDKVAEPADLAGSAVHQADKEAIPIRTSQT